LQDYYAHGDFFTYLPGEITWPHNAFSPQTGLADPAGAPDDPNLDASGSDDGRPAGAAIQFRRYANGGVADYAVFVPGRRRIDDTQQASLGRLTAFREYLRTDGGCLCKNYFGFK